jgi:hypothetical protein
LAFKAAKAIERRDRRQRLKNGLELFEELTCKGKPLALVMSGSFELGLDFGGDDSASQLQASWRMS